MKLSADRQKLAAAHKALELVRPGMKLGLGTGSTAAHFVMLLGEAVATGLAVVGVPTSEQTAELARRAGVPLGTLDDLAPLDLTIDGADEIDANLRLIKGGGGALLREKIVAQSSRRMVVIADEAKQVERLGAFALPVEIVRFGVGATGAAVAEALANIGQDARITVRQNGDGGIFTTDEGHHILDCACASIAQPEKLSHALGEIAGVVDHGLFLGIATGAILGTHDGTVLMLGDVG
ncbi:MAG: ribose-5-phosphate isomerase RpiA [Alphaproteobacteria bacterium]